MGIEGLANIKQLFFGFLQKYGQTVFHDLVGGSKFYLTF